MAIPLTSESAPAPAALIDGDLDGEQMLIVEFPEGDPDLVALVREAEDPAVEGGVVAAGAGMEGKRVEYRCAVCGYGIVVCGRPPGCPMCSEARWQHVEWRPFSQPLDDDALPAATPSRRRRLRAPASPTAEEPIRFLRPGQAGASLEK